MLDRFESFSFEFFLFAVRGESSIVLKISQMNSFIKLDHGSLASAFFENTRRTDSDFRRKVYDSSE